MKVTSCQVAPIAFQSTPKTKAFVRVILDEQLQLTGLRVVDGSNGLFVAYPNDPAFEGVDFIKNIFYPVTKELREEIEQAVLRKYEEVKP